jgi:Cu(I)/Ag(I) efflux system membrane fusion protein
MFYHLKRTSCLFIASLAFGLLLVLFFGAQISFACGGCPLKKSCAAAKQTGTQSCQHPLEATSGTKAAAYACPVHPDVTSDKPGNCEKCSMKLVLMDMPTKGDPSQAQVRNPEAFKKVERHVCSMHPEVIEKKKGNCPECGMKLVQAEFYEVYVCPTKQCSHVSEKSGTCCGMKMNKKLMSSEEFEKLTSAPIGYACPMHPEMTSDKPGDCSKCGMKLKKTASLEEKSSKL